MRKNREIKLIFGVTAALFAVFLLVPLALVLVKSFQGEGGITLAHYQTVLTGKGFLKALGNSFSVSAASACVTVVLAFFLAYAVNYTNLPPWAKKAISAVTTLPMLLPTITYGFAIIYSFGKQGLLTRLLGFQPFEIYGFRGLMMGYVIYTLPTAFLLINNTFRYIDKKFTVVSRVMGDSKPRTFFSATLRPMLGTLATAFIQAFFLSFTDFGIPASVGGEFSVVATSLYNEMLGSIPNFNNGAVVAMVMLIPSVLSITLLNALERFNFRYNKISQIELKKNKVRDSVFLLLCALILLSVLSIFAVVFVIPFVQLWPYKLSLTLSHIRSIFISPRLLSVYTNSLLVAGLTALFGTLLAYGAALATSRSSLSGKCKQVIESTALVINTIPGMVLGIAFLFTFTGTPLQNTFFLLIICNIVHYFSTPYLMMKNSLSKMNSSWETTAMLMGDSWLKTILRVVTPNAKGTIFEVFSYYFVNAMVTISAVIFLTGVKTMVITTKIKELQHYGKFDEIFALSLLILATNLTAKLILGLLAKRKKNG